MLMGLNFLKFFFSSEETSLVQSSHAFMTSSERSSLVMRPLSYSLVILATLASAFSMSCFLSGGMVASQTATVIPLRVEYL